MCCAPQQCFNCYVIRRVSILADDESNTRPAFRQGSFFNGINVNIKLTYKPLKWLLLPGF
uniref:Uncharacterized protein n=1 Tax=Daphnia galeata TaxID=27404 RepID=A0A8J2RK99_9CRUS|nr:unnamed protein product [Daphnia galeata]